MPLWDGAKWCWLWKNEYLAGGAAKRIRRLRFGRRDLSGRGGEEWNENRVGGQPTGSVRGANRKNGPCLFTDSLAVTSGSPWSMYAV